MGAGFGAEAVRKYRHWRRTRLLVAPEVRNGAWINDRTVGWAHAFLMLATFAAIAWLAAVVLVIVGILPLNYLPA